MKEKYYSVKEVAEILGFNPETIRRMIRNKILFASKIGSGTKRPTYRISSEQLLRLEVIGYTNLEDKN